MTDKSIREGKNHAVSVVGRERAGIFGVTQVDSFDEHTVILKTDCGEMTVEGEELHVGSLDIAKGEVEITGRISAICYSDEVAPKRSRRGRFFG